ncbi:MAG: M2 family metallopeptidase [Bacteroidetes bacterium]|nr:M2 family metallopeptidase [Bacteroidota bacterium]MCW5894696.1 M2 family metallopeptidase [Bacteroidota bacterium]
MKHIVTLMLFPVTALLLTSCANEPKQEADEFLQDYNTQFHKLLTAANEAQWLANTDISDVNDSLATEATKVLARFQGSKEVIEKTKTLLAQRDKLDPLQVRQLEKIRLFAAHAPGTIPAVVDSLISATTKQTSALYGYEYMMTDADGKPKKVTTNEIDRILVESNNLKERLFAWETSKGVGVELRDGLEELQYLRNRVAREMGYNSYFDLEVADYGMSTSEMMVLMAKLVDELRPLYRELHTYARYELAKRYKQPVPDKLPAHWLPNRWGQNWPGLIKSVDLNEPFKTKTKEWIAEQSEKFYVSLGFPEMNKTFWEKSDLYPVEAGSARKKNNHASAWHINLADDYRSLMSIEPTAEWFRTSHHELGHIYYFIEYSNPDVPMVLRDGANRGYHEGIGDLMAIASMQQPYLQDLGLLPAKKIDQTQWLLNEALSSSSVVFIPFAAGTMSHFEHDLYEQNLTKDEYNKRWWEYVERFQGIVPPTPRLSEYCDAATKTHIIDDPGQYYDYAISCVLKFQLHDYIAKNILKQSPNVCNYYGNQEAGDFLRGIMRPGATRDWREVLKEKTGEDLSARAMLEYYQPLMEYLKKVNAGRKSTIQ